MDNDRVNPEDLDEDDTGDPEDEEGDEIDDPAEVMLAVIGDIMDNGMPVRFTASMSDPFLRPALVRLQRQNEILADISVSLRAIAVKLGCEVSSKVRSADLNQGPQNPVK
jgi:hypothetical protein